MDDEEVDNCVACRKQVREEQCYVCDSCLGRVHKDCMNLTASEIKCVPLQKRMLMLICIECRKLLGRLPYIVKMLEEIKQDVVQLKGKNGSMESSTLPTSYAGVLGGAAQVDKDRVLNTPTLIIESKDGKQDPKEIQEELRQNINPASLKVGIRGLRETKRGGLVVKCASKKELDILQNAAEKSLGSRYVVKVPKLDQPKIKVIGYTGKKAPDEIEDCVRKQNEWIGPDDVFKITYLRKDERRNVTTVLANCSPGLFHKMMKVKKVFIDWERYPVYEDLTVTRCFGCQGFYHKQGTCKQQKACKTCAGKHDSKVCQSGSKRCKNCLTANSLYRAGYAIDHEADDLTCPSYCYQLGILKSRIDYGTGW